MYMYDVHTFGGLLQRYGVLWEDKGSGLPRRMCGHMPKHQTPLIVSVEVVELRHTVQTSQKLLLH